MIKPAVCTATRHIAQAKLWPANLRLLDPAEAARVAGLDGQQAQLIIGFKSAEVPQGAFIHEALKLARERGGLINDDEIRISDDSGEATGREGAVGNWHNSFIGVKAGITNGMGLIADTFETAVTWDQWPEFDAVVREEVGGVLNEMFGKAGFLSCRFTHIYTDGLAPYYTFSGLSTPGVKPNNGRQSRKPPTQPSSRQGVRLLITTLWEECTRKRPDLFESVLRSAKKTVAPNGILNPGVLIAPSD